MELDSSLVPGNKVFDRFRLRTAVFLRPALPGAAELFPQRLEQRVGAHAFRCIPFRFRSFEKQLEDLELGGAHALVVDELRIAQFPESLLKGSGTHQLLRGSTP